MTFRRLSAGELLRRIAVEPPAILSEEQRCLVRHALGLPPKRQGGVATRNYYRVSALVGAEADQWREMEARGLAISWQSEGWLCFAAGSAAVRTVLGWAEKVNTETLARTAQIDRQIKSRLRQK